MKTLGTGYRRRAQAIGIAGDGAFASGIAQVADEPPSVRVDAGDGRVRGDAAVKVP